MDDVISKEELSYLYQQFSIREIAYMRHMSRGQIEHLLEKYCIPRRTVSDALRLSASKGRFLLKEEAKMILEDQMKVYSNHVKFYDIKPIKHNNILVPIPFSNERDAAITIVLSDLHLGDANHLPDTYWSVVENCIVVVKNIMSLYKIHAIYLVLNGDIVSGRDVFRFQELRNLIQRGHWQVFLAEYVLKETIRKIGEAFPVTKVFLVKGTHETLANNFVLYLKRMIEIDNRYLSHGGIVNIAGSLGQYNVLFTHGAGSSEGFPVSQMLIRDVLKKINTSKNEGVFVDRVCSGHTHWATSGLIIDDIYWDVTGGYQKWEYTLSQRPSGAIMYLWNNNEVSSMCIRPDLSVEESERRDVGLEYKNLVYYGNILLKHLRDIEKVDGSE